MPPFNTTIPSHDGRTFGAYYVPAGHDKAPTLILIQEIFGVNEGMRRMCSTWAGQGYNVLCPDLFWRQKPGVELSDKSEAEWQQAFGYYQGFDVALGIADLKSTLAHARSLKENNGKVATIGFCLGGKLAYLMAARSDATCNISYYGVGLDELLDEVPKINSPLLAHFAELDKYVAGDVRSKILAAFAKNPAITAHVYEGVDHAFARVNGITTNRAAADLAFERTKAFLKENL